MRLILAPESAALSVNGAAPVRKTLPSALDRQPNDALQIGDDLGSQVLGDKKPAPFKGWIESVCIYSGEQK